MQHAGFSADVPVYLASGVLSYGDAELFQKSVRSILENKLASAVLFKELYLSTETTSGKSPCPLLEFSSMYFHFI